MNSGALSFQSSQAMTKSCLICKVLIMDSTLLLNKAVFMINGSLGIAVI